GNETEPFPKPAVGSTKVDYQKGDLAQSGCEGIDVVVHFLFSWSIRRLGALHYAAGRWWFTAEPTVQLRPYRSLDSRGQLFDISSPRSEIACCREQCPKIGLPQRLFNQNSPLVNTDKGPVDR